MANSAYPDQLASSGRVYPGSAGQGLNSTFCKTTITIIFHLYSADFSSASYKYPQHMVSRRNVRSFAT